MKTLIALLRAVNIGGTGKLPMQDLRELCESLGFADVRTVLASGNVIFSTGMSEAAVKVALEERLAAYMGKPVRVIVRSGPEMAAVLAGNPFPDGPPNRTAAIFLDEAPSPDALSGIRGRTDEDVALGKREIYVRYGENMGKSKLRIPGAAAGTGRNMNTVAKLAALAADR
jgi:uncharacterized protein (DUF1697 family)